LFEIFLVLEVRKGKGRKDNGKKEIVGALGGVTTKRRRGKAGGSQIGRLSPGG